MVKHCALRAYGARDDWSHAKGKKCKGSHFALKQSREWKCNNVEMVVESVGWLGCDGGMRDETQVALIFHH